MHPGRSHVPSAAAPESSSFLREPEGARWTIEVGIGRARPVGRPLWFSSYIQTYLERDVRAITNVRDLATFRRFLALVASRHGQLLNKTDLAAPLGVSVPTIGEWLRVLEITGQIILAPPYFENFGKRLIKSPKVYIGDPGMACYLLGITTQKELDRSPFVGPLWEGYVAAVAHKCKVDVVDGDGD